LEVNNNYELANIYARLGQRDKALAMYQRALDANAGYDEIYFNRATMSMQTGLEAEAIHYYRMALAINPTSREGYNALGGIYVKDLAKNGDAAEALYRRGVEIFPTDKDMWNTLGVVQFKRNRFADAEQSYRKAVEIDPTFQVGLQNLAIVSRVRKENASKESAPKP
jgi:tetratricopeptide (TPR) repeat protein